MKISGQINGAGRGKTLLLLLISFLLFSPSTPARGENSGLPYLKFCGANGTIFGSCHLLHTADGTILLDCGLFQQEGYSKREVERRNRFIPFNPRDIDAILVSHAHADHIGRIPYLVRKGFSGKIYCTEATAEVARAMLPLLNWILSKDNPLHSLYNKANVAATLNRLVPCKYYQEYTLPGGIHFRFLEAGHILGSAMIEVKFRQNESDYSILFTGDIGNPHNPLNRPQDRVMEEDYVICESTYGNRRHGNHADDMKIFRDIINSTVSKSGKVLIPSYVLSRTQNIIYLLDKLIKEKAFQRSFPVYVDSIYANRMTRIYRKNTRLFNQAAQETIRGEDPPLFFTGLKETKPRDKIIGPAVIIAPSGMVNVGSIRKHLQTYLPNPYSSVLFVGFQPKGGLGRKLLEGAKRVEIDGKNVPVRASIYYLTSFSGHGDYRQIVSWLKDFQRIGKIFIVHGKPDSSRDFAKYIEAHTPFKAYVPKFLEKIYLPAPSSSNQPKSRHLVPVDKSKNRT